jgi:hypothetical protein
LTKDFLVFCTLKYSKNVIIPLEKNKNQGMHLGVFHICVLSLWFFCDSRVHKGHSGISILRNNYLKKVLAHHVHALMSRCHPQCLRGPAGQFGDRTCPFVVSLDVPMCPLSYKATGVNVLWLVSCRRLFLFFLSSFLFLLEKVYLYLLFYRFVNFSPFVFYCLFSFLVLL